MILNERCISDIRSAFVFNEGISKKDDTIKSNIEEEVINNVNTVLSGIFLNICSNVPDMYNSVMEEYGVNEELFKEKNLLIHNVSILSIVKSIALPLSLMIKSFRAVLKIHYPDCNFSNITTDERITKDSLKILEKEVLEYLKSEVSTDDGIIHPMMTSRMSVTDVKNIMEGWINDEKKEK